jgi:acetyl-CoA C-acetyltransferase
MERDVVICEPIRTAVGGYGGMYVNVSATELAATLIRHMVHTLGVPIDGIDDVILGQCYPNAEAPAIGRVAALDAGLPITTPGQQIDRRCGSGLQAVINAVMQVGSGASDLVLAGGAESMSQAEYYTTSLRWGARAGDVVMMDRLARGRITPGGKNFPVPGGMIETAENLRREYKISREEQDLFAVGSHLKAAAAQSGGLFDAEIVDVTVTSKKGDQVIRVDEHPRADSNVEALGKLRPMRGKVDAEATVTAGNTSGQNDGASLSIVTTPERAEALGLTPFARLKSWAVAGVEPSRMGIGPVHSTALALERAGLNLKDIDLIELNEAFAAQVLACTREWNFAEADFDRLNVNGSGISLGHPVGATGGRILATLLREMARRDVRYGLETMCIGGGQGITAIFEKA